MSTEKPLDTLLDEIEDESPSSFHPCAWFNEDGDMVEVHLSSEAHVVQWVSPVFGVFVSATDPGKIIGLAIQNAREYLGSSGVAKVAFSKGRATVRLVLAAALLATELADQGESQKKGGLDPRLVVVLDELGDTKLELENLEALTAA